MTGTGVRELLTPRENSVQLNSTALCRNIIRGIGAADLPPLESFPRAHQVTYQYYMAVFAFLREDYAEAERRFRVALEQCHHRMKRNIEYVPVCACLRLSPLGSCGTKGNLGG